MSQLIRCRVPTPYRSGGCNCPIRWRDGRWVHDPDLETGVGEPYGLTPEEARDFHRIHVGVEPRTAEEAGRTEYSLQAVYTCLHTPRPSSEALRFLDAALKDRPRDLEMAKAGHWIHRRRPPRPEGELRPPREDLERVAKALYEALLYCSASAEAVELQRAEALGAYEAL